MTVKELREILDELNPDISVRVIVDGKYDMNPTLNVCDDELWVEGVSEEKEQN